MVHGKRVIPLAVESNWFRIHPARDGYPRFRLYCLPPAGAGTAFFHHWLDIVPEWMDLALIKLPGRDARYSERRPDGLHLLADQVADEIASLTYEHGAPDGKDVPYGLFGHSMGGWLAYEIAVRLEKVQKQPSHLFVSGIDGLDHAAVRMEEASQPGAPTRLLHSAEGPFAEMLGRPGLVEHFRQAVAADLALLHDYIPSRESVDCSLTALWSPDDESTRVDGILNWGKWTRRPLKVWKFAGGHDFPLTSAHQLLALLSELELPAETIRFVGRAHHRVASDQEREVLLNAPEFGRVFTDHMVSMRWSVERGWHGLESGPREPIAVDPSCMGLHYGQSIFEGLKAYRKPDGTVSLFRPYDHARRFQESAGRIAMPTLPESLFVAAAEELLRLDERWLGFAPERSLYIRPVMFATEASLGLRPAREYVCILTASPAVTPSAQPVSAWVCEDFVRAARGGSGSAKAAGNYAPGLLAQTDAQARGFDQIVWLDAEERRWVEEMATMNLFFVHDDGSDKKIVTPRLTDSILSGVTRRSLLQLSQDMGFRPEERRVSLAEWWTEALAGRLTETFGCGTAGAILPLASAASRDRQWVIGDGKEGPVTRSLRTKLADLQSGMAPDPYGWMHPVFSASGIG
ncbi:branched-chain amino acid aminotransferase [Streptomyces rhizosphaericus]|nr:branched-chain amino acid aminotransferase [Streptomyces rhizosphaericus]